MKYYINYHTGAGNEWVEADSIYDVQAIADDGAAYTQEDITIEDEDDNVLARRRWCGAAYDPEEAWEENPICFGEYGYFGDWC